MSKRGTDDGVPGRHCRRAWEGWWDFVCSVPQRLVRNLRRIPNTSLGGGSSVEQVAHLARWWHTLLRKQTASDDSTRHDRNPCLPCVSAMMRCSVQPPVAFLILGRHNVTGGIPPALRRSRFGGCSFGRQRRHSSSRASAHFRVAPRRSSAVLLRCVTPEESTAYVNTVWRD